MSTREKEYKIMQDRKIKLGKIFPRFRLILNGIFFLEEA